MGSYFIYWNFDYFLFWLPTESTLAAFILKTNRLISFINNKRYEVLSTVKLSILVFSVLAPRDPVTFYQRNVGTCHFHLQSKNDFATTLNMEISFSRSQHRPKHTI